jgi:hypothetical protein
MLTQIVQIERQPALQMMIKKQYRFNDVLHFRGSWSGIEPIMGFQVRPGRS